MPAIFWRRHQPPPWVLLTVLMNGHHRVESSGLRRLGHGGLHPQLVQRCLHHDGMGRESLRRPRRRAPLHGLLEEHDLRGRIEPAEPAPAGERPRHDGIQLWHLRPNDAGPVPLHQGPEGLLTSAAPGGATRRASAVRAAAAGGPSRLGRRALSADPPRAFESRDRPARPA